MDLKEQVKLQFGKNAHNYVGSTHHAEGEDLLLLSEWAKTEQATRALDIATGSGHAALTLAPWVAELTAFDLTPQMLETARKFLQDKGYPGVRFVPGDAERMPFGEASFELVACRIAAHHFPDPASFVKEAARVLAPDGCFLLLDNIAPEADEMDRLYNEVEKLRDPSHARAWKKTEWIRMTENAGLRLEQLIQSRKTFLFKPWCARMSLPDTERRSLEALILGQSEEMKRRLGVTVEAGRLIGFQGDYMMLKARKVG
ncbi:class I SAM-dependent methyltransferase [Paenibacillus filicis]|uniref:Class I SAM-dependent methyltransferase n=1 Tax=Paenibacillus gyeongsangnamensis TaxID=3388067 RepID=A0ABT4QCU4_9BACL|nr:class I SAM-dependent methyltransferase [Paenibacillus filicis]MCZ8514679.1 class I SAM-dependent methyltransferase [Paenibacillus filicis]